MNKTRLKKILSINKHIHNGGNDGTEGDIDKTDNRQNERYDFDDKLEPKKKNENENGTQNE
jgi:hypothetical protein